MPRIVEKTFRNAAIVIMRNAGATFPEIARKYGISPSRAHDIYRRAVWRAKHAERTAHAKQSNIHRV